MKTFNDCYNQCDASEAAVSMYAFPWDNGVEDGFGPVYEAVLESRTRDGRTLNVDEGIHGLLAHFGCIDAFL